MANKENWAIKMYSIALIQDNMEIDKSFFNTNSLVIGILNIVFSNN